MANILFKKSYQLKNFENIPYENLWNKDGIFTTIRVTGKPLKFVFLKEHIKNFNSSLKKFSINFYLSEILFENKIKILFKNNYCYDHLLRIAISKKIISISLRKRNKTKENFIGMLVSYQRSKPSLKNLKYLKILKFIRSVKNNKCEIILFKNNKILEGCTTNILCIKNNKIYSPKSNYYKGITLKFFLKKFKKKIIMKDISKNFLSQSDEIIIVGSGKGVVKIDSIPQISWKSSKEVFFKKFYNMYSLEVK